METAILSLYVFFMGFIFLYSLIQGHLVLLYLRNLKRKRFEKQEKQDDLFEPNVTIQLPIFNEKFVIERLIDKISEMDYPKDKLEIQILDDSTDDTLEIVKNKVDLLKEQGFQITQFTRPKNTGFKAGALAEGMEVIKGEFIAIFDADFLPEKDFLRKTLRYFKDEKIGVVQTRWAHLNQEYSLLTKLQAFGLDAHFTVEQSGKNEGGHFINFNGTAGVWRKTCIYDAGGWQSDTLTEDLDLSYRAQMKGWKFKFLEEVGCPAELPVTMNALKTQQFRWTKGAAETAKKNLITLLKTKGIRFSTKLHGVFHLLNSFLFVCIFMVTMLSVPVLYVKHNSDQSQWIYKIAAILIVSLSTLGTYYYISQKRLRKEHHKSGFAFIYQFPLFLSVSMGLSLHNAIAVIEGYIGKKSPFVRTPKFNITKQGGTWKDKSQYFKSTFNVLTVMEIGMCFYAIFGIITAFRLNDFGLLPFHCMLAVGFGYVAFFSYKHSTA
jgi:cellulose synthase/poly-beta-1,6-N-acetylglucosamine synthase-like glycosyltransferase